LIADHKSICGLVWGIDWRISFRTFPSNVEKVQAAKKKWVVWFEATQVSEQAFARYDDGEP
jgi:hypothetical protein